MGDRVRTDRARLQLDQLVDGVQLSRLRLDGMTTAELCWEPWPGMWSLRSRGNATSPTPWGRGAWVLDADDQADPFTGAPLTTMAWRAGHLLEAFAGRNRWTFGTAAQKPTTLSTSTPTASWTACGRRSMRGRERWKVSRTKSWTRRA